MRFSIAKLAVPMPAPMSSTVFISPLKYSRQLFITLLTAIYVAGILTAAYVITSLSLTTSLLFSPLSCLYFLVISSELALSSFSLYLLASVSITSLN